MSQRPFLFPGIGRCHGDPDPADRDCDQGADLEQFEPQGCTGGVGELGVGQPDPSKSAQKHIGHGSEPQAQLVGAQGGRGRPVSEQVDLALFDTVFHPASGAIDFFVEFAGLVFGRLQGGDDETRIGLALRTLALAMTRLRQAQLSSVVHMKSLKRRPGLPLVEASASACARSASISATRRLLRARPKT